VPHATDRLTAFQRLDTSDKVMFGYVQGIKRALPSVPVEKALAMFAKDYGVSGFKLNVQRKRYQRILKDFFEDQRTKPTEKE
jgi:hypothetical protein